MASRIIKSSLCATMTACLLACTGCMWPFTMGDFAETADEGSAQPVDEGNAQPADGTGEGTQPATVAGDEAVAGDKSPGVAADGFDYVFSWLATWDTGERSEYSRPYRAAFAMQRPADDWACSLRLSFPDGSSWDMRDPSSGVPDGWEVSSWTLAAPDPSVPADGQSLSTLLTVDVWEVRSATPFAEGDIGVSIGTLEHRGMPVDEIPNLVVSETDALVRNASWDSSSQYKAIRSIYPSLLHADGRWLIYEAASWGGGTEGSRRWDIYQFTVLGPCPAEGDSEGATAMAGALGLRLVTPSDPSTESPAPEGATPFRSADMGYLQRLKVSLGLDGVDDEAYSEWMRNGDEGHLLVATCDGVDVVLDWVSH